MDPNATLAEIRRITHEDDGIMGDVDAERLVELVDALDGWLSRGGFLPDAWGRAQ